LILNGIAFGLFDFLLATYLIILVRLICTCPLTCFIILVLHLTAPFTALDATEFYSLSATILYAFRRAYSRVRPIDFLYGHLSTCQLFRLRGPLLYEFRKSEVEVYFAHGQETYINLI